MSAETLRKPTADEVQGMAWWNSLSEQNRRFWLGSSAVPADAWAEFKRARDETDGSVSPICDN